MKEPVNGRSYSQRGNNSWVKRKGPPEAPPKSTVVKQNPENVIPVEILAESIKEIAQGMKKMRSGKLNDRAIVLLIQDQCRLGQKDILAVMDAIQNLESEYLRKDK